VLAWRQQELSWNFLARLIIGFMVTNRGVQFASHPLRCQYDHLRVRLTFAQKRSYRRAD